MTEAAINSPILALKSVVEYPLPASSQTHEVIAIAPTTLLVSQQPSGAVVKVRVDPHSGRPLEAASHVIDNAFTGLHGLTVSKNHPGCVWITLQFTSELILVDPVAEDLHAAPRVLKRIKLPAPARGPHVVAEHGNTLWASCKDSHHVVRIDADNPANFRIIDCPPRPIFAQLHPTSGDVYATLDQSSALFRIPASSAEQPSVIPVPPEHGSTPVGMVPGPDGNLWFALLGNSAGGNGSFGRIRANGQIDFYKLGSAPAAGAGFIHLGFPPAATQPLIYLLASSMASGNALNGVVELTMNADYSRVEKQQTIAFPSQHSMTHRVLCTPQAIYATELGSCALAHLHVARSPYGEGINEAADPYSLWGCGVPGTTVRYPGL
ncbi:hypothetical protein SAMN02745857_00141 [Andreprevotia lacus DSM 23236]|uniref:DNA-binding beta-propeller fold protein YncE n=1 Tax=Andreprevotia lacus DSM 23236 TaxID=1121001 RepID=A0A1W1WX83_9NEIS|nr:hypothetical protein [Andreprevotia lacus]SMC16255.1 hypothetical protein SAMN02745857_00141 [Andreprevotia lacus DSM 23236]